MSNHKITLLPLASGYFQSPELLATGRKCDLGIFAESLVYYDSVYVHVDNPEQFAEFITSLLQQGLSFELLNELIENESIRFFNTVSLHPFMGFGLGPRTIVSSFYSIEEKAMSEPGYFSRRFLEFEGLSRSLRNLSGFDKRAFGSFLELAAKHATTFSSESFAGDIVDNAYEDFLNPSRCKHITKSLLEELYSIHQLGNVPDFDVRIREMDSENYDEIAHNPSSAVISRYLRNGGRKIYEVDYSIRTENLKGLGTDKRLVSFQTLPLSCAGVSNLYIKCAGKLGCDLFLCKPIGKIVGDKLFEISDLDISKTDIEVRNVIDTLQADVDFPDLRCLVNAAQIDFNKVLEIRANAKLFRTWLQTEADRDPDSIVAYHGEVAKQSGFTRIEKTSLKVFGVLSLLSIYSKIRFKDDTSPKKFARAPVDELGENLFDFGAKKLGGDWTPVCFGDWYNGEIAQILQASKQKPSDT